MKQHDKHELYEKNESLNLEQLESRLEMESVAALALGLPSGQLPTTPICICHF